jgi:hypothetical protein
MQLIKPLYRANYTGEEVTTQLVYQNNRWNATNEFVHSQITNLQISNQALVIVNGSSRSEFDLRHVKTHRAGLLGANRLQTYGCNASYRDYESDFLVAIGEEIVQEIAQSDYCDDNIVYANAESIVQYPKQFYLLPQDPHWNSGAIAAYLACFDGHQKVYLMGFDGNDSTNGHYNVYANTVGYYTADTHIPEDYWEQTMLQVMNTYPTVDFVRVMPTRNFRLPESWKYQTNLRTINFRDFVLEADL